jgi:hypothetical protein
MKLLKIYRKIYKIYKANGLEKTIHLVLERFFLTFGYGVYRINRREHRAASKIFANRQLDYSEHGYWFVNPMPTESELLDYYSHAYWASRGDKKYSLKMRDIQHFLIIKNYLNDYFYEKRTILNFGAGHGGISHLFWILGHEVINIEPSGIPQFYKERWKTYKNLSFVTTQSVDLIYGSHSLEHVVNLDDFLLDLKSKLKKFAYVFWEVPNGDAPGNGPIENEITAPHTYYFQKKFFANHFSKILLNDSFFDTDDLFEWEKCRSESGHVIRVLGSY